MEEELELKQEKAIEERRVDVGELPPIYGLKNTAWLHVYDKDEDNKDNRISFADFQKAINALEDIEIKKAVIFDSEIGASGLVGCEVLGGTVEGAAIKGGTLEAVDVKSGKVSASVTVEGSVTLAQGIATKQYVDDAIAGYASTKVVCQARLSADQPAPSATLTKILYDVKDVDTHECFDASLARFCPKIAGWYKITVEFTVSNLGESPAQGFVALVKNGAEIKRSSHGFIASSEQSIALNMMVYLGRGDYLEVWGYRNLENPFFIGGQNLFMAEYICA